TARMLAEHFDRVTVVERDRFPVGPLPRKGVPQSRHIHVLMKRGRLILEEYFPGLQDEMVDTGAPVLDMAGDAAWLTPAGWGLRFPSDLTMLACTRDFLDWNVRRRLADFAKVSFLQQVEVTRLLPNADESGVAGVAIHLRNSADGNDLHEYSLHADVVVDASGRGSRAPQWLASLGYAPPAETVINGFLGYASRLYQPPAGFKADWKCLYIQAAPPNRTRAGLLFPVEGGRWLVTLSGGGRDYPPTDEAGFVEFARSLASPMLYDAIKDAAPLSPIHSYRATENRLRHYERLSRWPDNFMVLGDAACAFNPVYGQGMTIAALGVKKLDEILRMRNEASRTDGRLTGVGLVGVGLAGIARRFQQEVAKVNTAPWLLATGEDFRYRETVGGSPTLATRLMHRYMDQVIRLSTENREVRTRFMEIFHMLKPPSAMFHPLVLRRVAGQAWRLMTWPKGTISPTQTVAGAGRTAIGNT
ncbi:MAG: FAD-dependent monooxygenase, partial [Acidobacteriota bacterium]|nr:FAD-dependent monooxygenase [Acidobacteriota bacterium]